MISAAVVNEYVLCIPEPHVEQSRFINSTAKRIMVKAGRRSGKTTGVAIRGVLRFLSGRRVLYAVPTQEQVDSYWWWVTRILKGPIDAGILYKNETEHIVEMPGTKQRIRAKTAWNADTLRGDYADDLTLDEFQLMSEDAWGLVGAPMLLDNDGDAVFMYTPPCLHSQKRTRARDPQYASKLFKRARADNTGRWATFHFTSHDNPYISKSALNEITKDMTSLAYRMEIQAEDVDEAPGALWQRDSLDKTRVVMLPREGLSRVVVGVDPSGTSGGDEIGIVTAGGLSDEYYTMGDDSMHGSPLEWASAVVAAYYRYNADAIIAEGNYGGEMVLTTIAQIDKNARVKLVTATRGKQVRAEPVAAAFEQGRGHMVGVWETLENELCLWTPGDSSPNRLDAMVWAYTELMKYGTVDVSNLGAIEGYKSPWE